MCLIVHRLPGGGNIPSDVIRQNLGFNGDGFGIAWRDNGKVEYQKFSPDDDEQFVRLLKQIDARRGVEYVAHFRKATHGACTQDLAHPFPYTDAKGDEILVFHNGVIDIKTHGKQESDTSAFVARVMSRLPHRWWKIGHLKFLVEQSIGWSRMLVMTADETIRLNEQDWKVMGGIWYSTDPIWKPYSTSGTSGTSGSKGIYYGWTQAWDDDWITKAGHFLVPVDENGKLVCDDCGGSGAYKLLDKKRVFLSVTCLPLGDQSPVVKGSEDDVPAIIYAH